MTEFEQKRTKLHKNNVYRNVFYSDINSLKTEFFLNNIYKFISYLTANTLRLCCKDQPVKAV
jgi:hypothetical protein